MKVLFPIYVYGSGQISEEYDVEAYIVARDTDASFKSLVHETGFDVYAGEMQSSFNLLAVVEPNTGDYYYSSFFVSTVSFDVWGSGESSEFWIECPYNSTMGTSFAEGSTVSLIPSDIQNLVNIFYWHQNSVVGSNYNHRKFDINPY